MDLTKTPSAAEHNLTPPPETFDPAIDPFYFMLPRNAPLAEAACRYLAAVTQNRNQHALISGRDWQTEPGACSPWPGAYGLPRDLASRLITECALVTMKESWTDAALSASYDGGCADNRETDHLRAAIAIVLSALHDGVNVPRPYFHPECADTMGQHVAAGRALRRAWCHGQAPR